MSHRITLEEARIKREREEEIKQMIAEGKSYKSKRLERRKQRINKKRESFIDKLKRRGGFGPDNEEKKKKQEKKDGNN